jgi:hypothetical protein
LLLQKTLSWGRTLIYVVLLAVMGAMVVLGLLGVPLVMQLAVAVVAVADKVAVVVFLGFFVLHCLKLLDLFLFLGEMAVSVVWVVLVVQQHPLMEMAVAVVAAVLVVSVVLLGQ